MTVVVLKNNKTIRRRSMKTNVFLTTMLLVSIQNLAQHALAEDEPDIEDFDGDEEPEVPMDLEALVEEDDDDEPDVEDEPDAFYEPEIHVVEKHTAYTGECTVIEKSPLGDDDAFFEFHQHDARLDPNRLVRVAYKIISTIRSELVKKVVLDYNPQLHHDVGPYPIVTHVTTEKDGVSREHCYSIVIVILDTDECTKDKAHPDWYHNCDDSTICVNTEGGYYCACKDGEFAFPGSGNGQCKSELNSLECCGSSSASSCRSDFKCHSDSCSDHDCPSHSMCIPGSGNSFTCQCNEGFRDVGEDKPGYECKAVDHCFNNKCSSNCDCESVVNATMDGYFCHPKEGDTAYYPSDDEWEVKPEADQYRLDGNHLCLDQDKAPILVIEGEDPMVLEQGSKYVEHGVLIVDEDGGDLSRRFLTTYEDLLLQHPSGYVKQCGESLVNYQLETPWISSQPTTTTTREVEIIDVDECTYDGDDEDFKHTCVGFATCNNQPCGVPGLKNSGFTCVCLDEGYEDDGNNGCEDKRPPIMECENSQSNCGFKHLWVMKGAGAVLDEVGTPVVYYDDESDDVNWLSETISKIQIPALKAKDMIPSKEGDDEAIDLTQSIRKGVLTNYEKDGLWIQPFYVTDASGNEATFNVQFTVTVITADMIAHLLPQVVIETIEDDFGNILNNHVALGDESVCDGNPDGSTASPSIWSYFWFLSLCYCAHLALVMVCSVATAVQVLITPRSMTRDRFDKGMDTLLIIQSLGRMSSPERIATTERKWKEITSF